MVYDRKKEVDEAIGAIDYTLGHLIEAQKYLHSASNWGVFDILGGGFFATMIKHEKIDDAKEALMMAKDSIKSLKKELLDVNEVIDVDLKLNDFLKLADYFFDGIVADWMVQSKIKDAQTQVDQAIEKLEEIKKCLKSIDY
ncbi:hypothetical protein [Thomasclavelia sp.]